VARANPAVAQIRLASASSPPYCARVIATVTKKRQVVLPAQICDQLGITSGARLDFRVRRGKLEAVKLPPDEHVAPPGSLTHLYTHERNAEELAIQKGCTCAAPDDFPQ